MNVLEACFRRNCSADELLCSLLFCNDSGNINRLLQWRYVQNRTFNPNLSSRWLLRVQWCSRWSGNSFCMNQRFRSHIFAWTVMVFTIVQSEMFPRMKFLRKWNFQTKILTRKNKILKRTWRYGHSRSE